MKEYLVLDELCELTDKHIDFLTYYPMNYGKNKAIEILKTKRNATKWYTPLSKPPTSSGEI